MSHESTPVNQSPVPAATWRVPRRRAGVALLLVLAITVLLASLAISFHDETLNRLVLARMTAQDQQALVLARSGICLAKALLRKDKRRFVYFPSPEDLEARDAETDSSLGSKGADEKTPESKEIGVLERAYAMLARTRSSGFAFEGGRLSISIEDESGRLNLNRATQAQLAALFSHLGLSKTKKFDIIDDVKEDISRELALSVMNWRAVEGLKVPGGATDNHYRSLDPPYVPRSGNFELPAEMLLVKDVTRDHLYGTPPTVTATEAYSVWEVPPGWQPDAAIGADDEGDETSRETEKKSGSGSEDEEEEEEEEEEESRPGLASLLTVFGNNRINVNAASEHILRVQPGIFDSPSGEAIVKALIENRPFSSVPDALRVASTVDNRAAARMNAWVQVTGNVLRIRATAWIGKRKKMVETVILRQGEGFRHLMYRQN